MISLIAFARNDDHLVPEQTKRFFHSIECQTNRNFELLFADCSIEQPLDCPRGPNIKIYQWPFKPLVPAYTRNCLAMQAKGDYICHINADCMYSPNFVDVLSYIMREEVIAFCRRKTVHWTTWQQSIFNIQQAAQECVDLKFDSYCTTGECQAIGHKEFINIGGYYQLIKNGVSCPADWKTHGQQEDCDLFNRTMHLHRCYIDEIPGVWILHLGHPVREAKMAWDDQKNK